MKVGFDLSLSLSVLRKVGRNIEETVRILDGFQYADSHPGEGCPANWEKGKATIKANADGSKDFFAVWKVV